MEVLLPIYNVLWLRPLLGSHWFGTPFPSIMAHPNFTFLYHNVQGFNSPNKCRTTFNYFSSLRADVMCLQDTGFSPLFAPLICSQKLPPIPPGEFEEKKQGVLVVLHKRTPFVCKLEIADPISR